MKASCLRASAVALFLACGTAVIPSAALAASKDKGLEVLISADAIPSPEGFRPKPGQPVHYLLSLRKETLGDTIAGVKLPSPQQVQDALVAELEKQGFKQTGLGGPLPQLMIVATVGDANFKIPAAPTFGNPILDPDFEPYLRQVNVRALLVGSPVTNVPMTLDELFDLDGEFPSPVQRVNQARDMVVAEALRIRANEGSRAADRSRLLALVGAAKVNRAVAEGAMSAAAADRIADAARDNLYYITLNAFDAVAWQNKQQVVLWRTTMLIDWRQDFSKALTEMLAQAGPVFGADVAAPGYVNTTQREGSVEIGTMKVVPENERTPGGPESSGGKK